MPWQPCNAREDEEGVRMIILLEAVIILGVHNMLALEAGSPNVEVQQGRR